MLVASPVSAKTNIPKPQSSANPVTYGKSVVVSGTVTGNPSAGLAIKLQANAFPYAGFVDVATSASSATGAYSFTVSPRVNTRYRVVTVDAPTVESSELFQTVAQKVSFRVSDKTPKRRSRVRFYGSVAPANDGGYVQVQKMTSTGAFKTVTKILLIDAGDTASRYSRKIRISRSGVYRILAPATTSVGEGNSKVISLRTH